MLHLERVHCTDQTSMIMGVIISYSLRQTSLQCLGIASSIFDLIRRINIEQRGLVLFHSRYDIELPSRRIYESCESANPPYHEFEREINLRCMAQKRFENTGMDKEHERLHRSQSNLRPSAPS
jgi:hypothetical protein